MIMEFGIVGNQKILRKVLKAVVHDERGKTCWREQFESYPPYYGKWFR